MRLDYIAAAAAARAGRRPLRRVLIALIIAGCAIIALYQFTVAGNIALSGQYGDVNARLIVGFIYAVLALILLAVLWAVRAKPARIPSTPALSNLREIQLVMLVEAAMLGYSLGRNRERAS